jgi:phosphoglycolate phosphatase-like HAD superfamily hydrolase
MDHNDDGRPTRQRWKVTGVGTVTVEFLIQPSLPSDKGGRLHNIEPDFAARFRPCDVSVPAWPLSERWLVTADDQNLVHQALVWYRERFEAVSMFENEVYPDVPASLDTLVARGRRLFVATSKPRVFAERIIDHFGFTA